MMQKLFQSKTGQAYQEGFRNFRKAVNLSKPPVRNRDRFFVNSVPEQNDFGYFRRQERELKVQEDLVHCAEVQLIDCGFLFRRQMRHEDAVTFRL